MSKARNLSDLLDANGDVKSTALDNVPPSNDASALTTGTLPNARLSSIPNSALANPSVTINGSALALGGSATVGGDKLSRQVNLASGASTTNAKIINTNQSGQVEQYPTMNTVGTYINDQNETDYNYIYSANSPTYRVRYVLTNVSNKSRITMTGEVLNSDGTYTVGSSAYLETNSNGGTGTSGSIVQWKDNYWQASTVSGRAYDGDYHQGAVQMFTVNPSNGNVSMLGTRYTKSDNSYRGANVSPAYGGSFYANNHRGAPTMGHVDSPNRNVAVSHYKCTTSGLSNIQNFDAGNWFTVYNGPNRTSQSSINEPRQSREISSNRTICLSGNNVNVFDFSGTGGTQIQNGSTTLNSDYSSEGTSYFINNTHFLLFYRDIYGKRRAQTWSYSNTTYTKIDDFEYEDYNNPTVFGTISDFRVKSNTEIALRTSNGLSAIELDSSYNILGMKTPLVISGLTGDLPYISGNIFLTYNTAPDGTKLVAPYTVNAYKDDFAFIYGGVAQSTSSSGTAEIAYGGIADGFTGLTVGQKYYVDPSLNGNITTASTSGIVVGTAISPTEILLGDVR